MSILVSVGAPHHELEEAFGALEIGPKTKRDEYSSPSGPDENGLEPPKLKSARSYDQTEPSTPLRRAHTAPARSDYTDSVITEPEEMEDDAASSGGSGEDKAGEGDSHLSSGETADNVGNIFENPGTNPFLQGDDETALKGYILMQAYAEFIDSIMVAKDTWSEEKLLEYYETMIFGIEGKTMSETLDYVTTNYTSDTDLRGTAMVGTPLYQKYIDARDALSKSIKSRDDIEIEIGNLQSDLSEEENKDVEDRDGAKIKELKADLKKKVAELNKLKGQVLTHDKTFKEVEKELGYSRRLRGAWHWFVTHRVQYGISWANFTPSWDVRENPKLNIALAICAVGAFAYGTHLYLLNGKLIAENATVRQAVAGIPQICRNPPPRMLAFLNRLRSVTQGGEAILGPPLSAPGGTGAPTFGPPIVLPTGSENWTETQIDEWYAAQQRGQAIDGTGIRLVIDWVHRGGQYAGTGINDLFTFMINGVKCHPRVLTTILALLVGGGLTWRFVFKRHGPARGGGGSNQGGSHEGGSGTRNVWPQPPVQPIRLPWKAPPGPWMDGQIHDGMEYNSRLNAWAWA